MSKEEKKIDVLNNIIGINPTGILDYQGTYKLMGANDLVRSSAEISKENLNKIQREYK